jgi:hypothetical protein
MRLNFRLKIRGTTFFMMLAHTQELEGITSLLPNGKHIIFWDLENCLLKDVLITLKTVQKLYDLSDIFITADTIGSYRAWCFKQVKFKWLIHILLDTEYVDYSFLYYTVKRKKATLRISQKQNRPSQKIIAILPSYSVPIPENVEKVLYDTGTEKRGKTIILGENE